MSDTQTIDVSLSIQIPDDSVIIKKVEYEELKEKSLEGVYWNMKDLEKHTGKSSRWLKDNILYREDFKKVLDVNNLGFVYYPETQGNTWAFQAKKMAEFLERNFHKIFI